MGSEVTVSTTRVSSPSRRGPSATHSRRSPSPSTCVPCRNKHLKCDGLQQCFQCSFQGIQCVYLQSRRGLREPAAKKSSTINRLLDDAENKTQDYNDLDSLNLVLGQGLTQETPSPSLYFPVVSKSGNLAGQTSRTCGTKLRLRCMEAFFQNFSSSHPFLPPRHEMLRLLKTYSMHHLESAICFVGSRYLPGAPSASFAEELDSLLLVSSFPMDGSTVQALLLFALGLDSDNDQKKASDVLLKAETLALELGMNHQEYAVINGLSSSIYEESLRRTWWELYVVRIMMAGFHQRGTFCPRNIMSTVPLPCEEREFAAGCILPLHTIEEFENEPFGSGNINWSSYTYRISAVRNLERMLQSNEFVFSDDPGIERLDSYLVNWSLNLPPSKGLFDINGDFDEMLFQAQMITNVSSILLHRPHLRLDSLAVQPIASCTGQPPPGFGLRTDNIHMIKTEQAASNITQLVTLPTPLTRHTHFFICAITLASVVHLSLWAASDLNDLDHDRKEQIRMEKGALKTMAGVWSSAKIAFDQVTKVAQTIHMNRKGVVDGALWRDYMDKNIAWSLPEDGPAIDMC